MKLRYLSENHRPPVDRSTSGLAWPLPTRPAENRIAGLVTPLRKCDVFYYLFLKSEWGRPCLRMLGALLLSVSIVLSACALSARAQASSETELQALIDRIFALHRAGKFSDAIRLAERSVSVAKALYGRDAPQHAAALNNLAQLFQQMSRYAEAEPLMRQALAINEKAYGPEHPSVAINLNNLAGLFGQTGREAQAEPLMRRALAIEMSAYGADHPSVARDLSNLAAHFSRTGRYAEAEKTVRWALDINETAFGPDHPNVATNLNILTGILTNTNRLAQAEPLMRRALVINEKARPNHPAVAAALSNLAQLLLTTNRPTEAEPMMRRALAISESAFGPDHPAVAHALSDLALLLQYTNRLTQAELLMRRALAINKTVFGSNDPIVARDLNNLAQIILSMNRLAEAEPLIQQALAIEETAYGPDHPNLARSLMGLRTLRDEQNDWAGSAELCLRAMPLMIDAHISALGENRAPITTVLMNHSANLQYCARANFRAGATANLGEGFVLAQWASQNEVTIALNDMSLRFAKGDAQLAWIVRAEQNLLRDRAAAYQRLDAIVGDTDAKAAEEGVIANIDEKLTAQRTQLRRDFPDYAELSSPQPLTIAEAQMLLGEDQALVVFLDMEQVGKVPGETLVYALTRTEARWLSVPLDTRALATRVDALRCGLDSSNWQQGEKTREICKNLLKIEISEGDQLPFDTGMAYLLYNDLFGGIKDLIKDKSLLIVPSGSLTQLPFSVLVTVKPSKTLSRFDAYKSAAWLGRRQSIAVLPSVSSLKALHTAGFSKAAAPFIGFGNPLLTGTSGNDKRAWNKQTCRDAIEPQINRLVRFFGGLLSLFRGGAVDVEQLRKQPPLPETADELCAVASGLGVSSEELDKTVYLGKRATVSEVKALSGGGVLARARVVHFATHGLLAGEATLFTQNRAEPALLLTPPAADEADEHDNGLLTASEVAQLQLDADWVILSACNTAAGESETAEALSGLARAFFYAGARSLLVSHWYVDSQAAVAITTGAITAMKREPQIGRAEALRRSVVALIEKGGRWSHPSIWAPFVLVGNGAQ